MPKGTTNRTEEKAVISGASQLATSGHVIEIKQADARTFSCPIAFDLAFCDPPFSIGQKYHGYKDNLGQEAQEEFVSAWMENSWRMLSTSGVLALHGPDDLAEIYLRIGKSLGGKRIAWVQWHYRFGMCGRHNWIDSRCHCIFFAKGHGHIWNPDAILVESDRVSYGDKRINDSNRGGKRVPFNVWGIPSDGPFWGRVQGTNAERWSIKQGAPVNHPNQLPIAYISRIIKAYTNPGSAVFDAFCGSGTVPLVCNALNRTCLSIDIDLATAESAKLRQAVHAKIAKERS